jgi:alpha-glucosidase
MNKIILYLVLVFLFNQLSAQTDQVIQPGNLKSLKKIDHGVLVKTDKAHLMIQVYQPQVIRVRLSQTPLTGDFSYSVIRQPEGNFKEIRETSVEWQLLTDSLKVIITKSPLVLKIYNIKDQVICEDYQKFSYTWQGTEVTSYKKLFPDEKFLGLGEKTGNVNRRGEKFENWNSDVPAYALNADPIYQSIPFYIGIHDKVTYGIFLDNYFRTKFNFGASTDEQYAYFSAANGEMNYYFFGASSIAGIIRDYTWLTGRMSMPPLWTMGYQQCRWSYFPESEVLSLAHEFRDKKIPCDVIYLDIDYMDSYKIFTWNKEKFPNPKEMIGKLNDLGFHVVTIVDPGIKIEKGYFAYDEGVKNNYFAKYPDGEFYTGSVWPGRCHFPDFTKETVRTWWGNSFTRLTEPGVEGFWNDMNEPATWGQSIPNLVQFDFDGRKASMAETHNVYGLNMTRATFEGTKKLINGKRPFVLTRAGFAGIQRYSAVWTGDNEATDDHMLLSARMVSSMGLSGISFAGPDVGGFMGNPSQELYQRWLAQGVYTPFFRNHSAWGTNHKEPWSFGEEVEKVSRELINQRYRLIPYLYSMFYQSTLTGMPVGRSLTIDYTFDEKVYWYDYQNEYLYGDNLLVVPVSCKQNAAKVYLPEGDWYRLSSGELFKGNDEVIVNAPLDDLPVFVKASGILPLQSVIQSTTQKPSSTLELHIYNGDKTNSFIYYEDDGTTYQYEKGEFYKRLITFDPVKRSISLSKVEGSFTSKFSSIRLVLHSFGEVMTLNGDGKDYTLKLKSSKERTAEIPLDNSEMKLSY